MAGNFAAGVTATAASPSYALPQTVHAVWRSCSSSSPVFSESAAGAHAQTVIWSATLEAESGSDGYQGFRVADYGTLSKTDFTYKDKSFSWQTIHTYGSFTFLHIRNNGELLDVDLLGNSLQSRPLTLHIGSNSWSSTDSGFSASANFGSTLALLYSAQFVDGNTYQSGGVTIEGKVRKLIAHDDSAYEEWGASAAIRIDPGSNGRGMSLTITPTWGSAASEAEQLWSTRTAEDLVGNAQFEAERRLDAELGYGVGGPYGWGTLTPYGGLSLSDGAQRTIRTGLRWKASESATVALEGTREENGAGETPANALMLRAQVRF